MGNGIASDFDTLRFAESVTCAFSTWLSEVSAALETPGTATALPAAMAATNSRRFSFALNAGFPNHSQTK